MLPLHSTARATSAVSYQGRDPAASLKTRLLAWQDSASSGQSEELQTDKFLARALTNQDLLVPYLTSLVRSTMPAYAAQQDSQCLAEPTSHKIYLSFFFYYTFNTKKTAILIGLLLVPVHKTFRATDNPGNPVTVQSFIVPSSRDTS